MNENTNQPVTFTFDGETLADLVNICAHEDKTPSAVVGEIIRETAEKYGLILKPAKSA
jgi:hypothetical protein